MITTATICALGLSGVVRSWPMPDRAPTQYVDPPPGPEGGLGLNEIPQVSPTHISPRPSDLLPAVRLLQRLRLPVAEPRAQPGVD